MAKLIRSGDVLALGPHRLMCGDAGDSEHVAKLFGPSQPALVFCSPPYLNQRDYGRGVQCWDTLMRRVFDVMPASQSTQILVNLGLVHQNAEWSPYWHPWLEHMRTNGWRRFGLYIWDKQDCMPGHRNGRLAPTYELIFHLNKKSRAVNKTQSCKNAGKRYWAQTSPKGLHTEGMSPNPSRVCPDKKVMDSVLHIYPEKARGAHTKAHGAVFPVALAASIHAAYSDPQEIVYDPFAGTGSSILAAEQEKRICYAMEISPEYCAIAIERWRARKPVQQMLALGS